MNSRRTRTADAPVVAAWLGIAVAVAALYAVGSQLAFTWFDADGANASFFPAAGVTVAAFVILPKRWWPAVIVGAGACELLIDLWHDIALDSALGYTAANLLQPLTGVLLLGARRESLNLSRLRSLTWFLVTCVLAGPLVGGIVGATTNVVLGSGTAWFRFVGEWWVGDGLGVLVVGTSLVAFRSSLPRIIGRAPVRRGWGRPATRLGESVMLIALAATSTLLAFEFEWYALLYAAFALLFMIAVRSGTAGVAIGGAAIAFVAAESTARGNPLWELMGVTDAAGLLYLQLGLAVLISCALVVAAGLAEREAFTVAYTTVDQERRQAEQARQRAELVRRVAEGLGHTTTPQQVLEALTEHGLDAAWPATTPRPPVSDTGRRRSALIAEQSDPSVLDSARMMAGDALERARLIEIERSARERAELLEHHAAKLAAAASSIAVAEVTVEGLRSLGPDHVAVWAIRDQHLVMLAAHPDASGSSWRWSGVALDAEMPLADCARRGVTIVHQSRADLVDHYPKLEHLDNRQRPAETSVAVPLLAQSGAVIGTLVVADAAPNWLTPERRTLVTSIAGQCGLALDRAELKSGVDRLAREVELLAELGASLERTTTVAARAASVVEALVAHGAMAALIETLEDDVHVPLASAGGHIGHGNEVVVTNLQARGRLLGRLSLRTSVGAAVRPQMLHEIASRTAIAIDNARMYETERDVSHRLQIGLLDLNVPTVEGVSIEAAYRPGTATLDVGGDWHDAFLLPSGSLGLVVGDVVGHGLDAAIAMTQLRGAARALAVFSSPAELLTRLDEFVESMPDAQMTTLVYVELDPVTGELRYACAGHPPPLIVSAMGTSRFLWDARSAPLGATWGEARPEATDRLANAERLMLYTDGLIERRRERLDDGLDRLLRLSRHDVSSDDFVDRMCDEMMRGVPQGDDICVLTASSRRPGSFISQLAPTPGSVATFRRQMREWLESSALLSSDESYEVVLAVSEAVSNAVEHAGTDAASPPIVVVADHIDAELTIAIRDHGRWREPVASQFRGRGLQIMQAVMDHVTTQSGDDGTIVRMSRSMSPAAHGSDGRLTEPASG